MPISGPIYSRGDSLGINTVKAYNSLAGKTTGTLVAGQAGYIFIKREGSNQSVSVINTTGTAVLVSGVPGYQIEVNFYTLSASTAAPIKFLSGSTDITGLINIGNSGSITSQSEQGILRTNKGESLSLNTTGTINGNISYRLV